MDGIGLGSHAGLSLAPGRLVSGWPVGSVLHRSTYLITSSFGAIHGTRPSKDTRLSSTGVHGGRAYGWPCRVM